MSKSTNYRLLLLLASVSAGVLHADEIVLESGDRFTGTVKRIASDEVIIDTSYAGEITVATEDVAELYTDEPLTVVFKDGDYRIGRISPAGDDRLQVQTEAPDGVEVVRMNDIEAAYYGDPQEYERERRQIQFEGSANAGLNRRTGNTETESYYVNGEFRARTPRNRYSAYAEYNRESTDDEETADNAQGSFKYDYFFNERWYIYNSVTLERDEFADLDLRSTLSVGSGYQFFDTGDRFLFGELGVAYVSEDFDVGEDEKYIAGRWAVDFTQALWSDAELFHVQEGLVGENPDDLIIRTRSGVRVAINDHLQLAVQANIDWDRSPSEDAGTTDKQYIITLGYLF